MRALRIWLAATEVDVFSKAWLCTVSRVLSVTSRSSGLKRICDVINCSILEKNGNVRVSRISCK